MQESVDQQRFVDAHVHLWDTTAKGLHWPWLVPGVDRPLDAGTLARPAYLPPQFLADAGTARPNRVVHVQAAGPPSDPVEESRWLERVADQHGLPDAIVGACSLGAPEAPELLRRHAELARVRGIRDMAATADLDLEAAAPALDVAGELGLSVELRLPPERTVDMVLLARRWPEVTFVLGHCGLPMRMEPSIAERWSRMLTELAAQPNWVCKIAGLLTRLGRDWDAAELQPWVRGCLDAFGPDRCMLGSNWPLDGRLGNYSDLVRALAAITSDLRPDDRDAVFAGTAVRVYRLEP